MAAAVRRLPATARMWTSVLFAAFVVRRDLVAADEQPQRFGRIGNLHAQVGRLEPVELHRQLRLAYVQRRVEVHDAGLLLCFRDDGIGVLLEPLQIRTVDRELNLRVLIAAAADRRDGPDAGAQVRHADGREDLAPHHVHQLELVAVALVDRRQPHVDRTGVLRPGRIVGHRDERVADSRQPLDPARDPVGDDLGGFEARALGRAHADLELGLVVVGQEVLVGDHEQRDAAEEHQHGDARYDGAVRERPAQDRRVAGIERAEEPRVA